jgi:Tol biopolymer transport system component
MSADGANPRLLSENAFNPNWAPSGLALIYGSVVEGRQNQLVIFDLATKTSRRLTNEPAVVPLSAFSPDGKWLIYQSNQFLLLDCQRGGGSRAV